MMAAIALLFGGVSMSQSQVATSSTTQSPPVKQEVKTTPPTEQSTSVTPVPKRERRVMKSPVAKKYTSKKIQHGKDRVDEAKKKRDVQPGSTDPK
jgi:hypothetical protein